MIGLNEKDVVNTLIRVNISNENFGKVAEVLTRMGILNRVKNELYQTCHLFKKAGNVYLVHFKEMYKMNGRESSFNAQDKKRRDKIATLLESYNLIKIENSEVLDNDLEKIRIDIIPYKEKSNFILKKKYSFGVENSRFYKNPNNF